jgi:hypothetical protein
MYEMWTSARILPPPYILSMPSFGCVYNRNLRLCMVTTDIYIYKALDQNGSGSSIMIRALRRALTSSWGAQETQQCSVCLRQTEVVTLKSIRT